MAMEITFYTNVKIMLPYRSKNQFHTIFSIYIKTIWNEKNVWKKVLFEYDDNDTKMLQNIV